MPHQAGDLAVQTIGGQLATYRGSPVVAIPVYGEKAHRGRGSVRLASLTAERDLPIYGKTQGRRRHTSPKTDGRQPAPGDRHGSIPAAASAVWITEGPWTVGPW